MRISIHVCCLCFCLLTSWPLLPKNPSNKAVCIYNLKLQYTSLSFGGWWWWQGEKGAEIMCQALDTPVSVSVVAEKKKSIALNRVLWS